MNNDIPQFLFIDEAIQMSELKPLSENIDEIDETMFGEDEFK